MELRWPWLLLVLPLVTLALMLWWSRGPTATADAVWVAHTERLRRLPRYAVLRRRQLAIGLTRTLAVLVLLAGAALLLARPQDEQLLDPDAASRDVMLCLDASGSMAPYNVQVIEQMRDTVSGLEGDRIGLTLWSGAAISVFPLTDDYAFVSAELDRAEQAFRTDDLDYITGTFDPTVRRASQLGDGLVSCTQRFDRLEEDRGRAIILASDNDPVGQGVFTPAEGAERAAEAGVVVHAVASPETPEAREPEFAAVGEQTGGTYSELGTSGGAEQIIDQINELEERRIEADAVRVTVDEPRVGTVVVGIGLLGLVLGWALEAAWMLFGRERRA